MCLRGNWAEDQFLLLNWIGDSRCLATFDQICDSLTIAVGITKELDPELIVIVPPDNGHLDGEWRFYVRHINV
jgi:hypothetical protein